MHWPRQAAMVDRQYGIGSRERLPSGRRVVFWMTGSPRETEAFLKSAPEQPLGKKGVLVLFAGGKRTVVSLDDLTPGDNIRIEGTDLRAEFRSWDPSMLAVELAIHSEKPRVEEMLLFADFPELNRQDYVNGPVWNVLVRPQVRCAGSGRADARPRGGAPAGYPADSGEDACVPSVVERDRRGDCAGGRGRADRRIREVRSSTRRANRGVHSFGAAESADPAFAIRFEESRAAVAGAVAGDRRRTIPEEMGSWPPGSTPFQTRRRPTRR